MGVLLTLGRKKMEYWNEGMMEWWDIGMLEYWNPGGADRSLMVPPFHTAIIPALQS
jgi:hypothetical protein